LQGLAMAARLLQFWPRVTVVTIVGICILLGDRPCKRKPAEAGFFFLRPR
jgi:hypothetical protein